MWKVALTSPSLNDNFSLPGGYKMLPVHLDQTTWVFCALGKDEYVKAQIWTEDFYSVAARNVNPYLKLLGFLLLNYLLEIQEESSEFLWRPFWWNYPARCNHKIPAVVREKPEIRRGASLPNDVHQKAETDICIFYLFPPRPRMPTVFSLPHVPVFQMNAETQGTLQKRYFISLSYRIFPP